MHGVRTHIIMTCIYDACVYILSHIYGTYAPGRAYNRHLASIQNLQRKLLHALNAHSRTSLETIAAERRVAQRYAGFN
jgi:hypothetical protein